MSACSYRGMLSALSGREPDRDVGGLERLLDRIDQISAHNVKINGLAQPHGKRGHYRFGVVMGPVEPAVHGSLDPGDAAD